MFHTGGPALGDLTTQTQINLAMIHLMGGYLMGNLELVPQDMRARFGIAVMYGYFFGGAIYHDRLLAFATIMALYGGMAINEKVRQMDRAKNRPSIDEAPTT